MSGAKDYNVGKGKPPKSTRFKPGQSGNPKGRPKGRKNLKTELDEVLNATVMLAKDPSLLQNAVNYANSGQGPATAIDRATAEFVDQFTALGGYFAERSTDVRDVGDRAIAAVLGVPAPGVPEFTEPSVVVAHDLAPAETAVLDRSLVAAIVTSC